MTPAPDPQTDDRSVPELQAADVSVLQAADVSVLQADQVSVLRGGAALLSGVSFAVREGEHWALVGPNGAGKTTLFGILGARVHPTSGTARVLGKRLGTVDLRELRALVGQVDQRFTASLPLSVHSVVLTGSTGTNLPMLRRDVPAGEEARALSLEDLLGINGITDRAWEVVSAGERSRTLIARALMPAPKLLLLDEPATGLDVVARSSLSGALSRLSAEVPTLATVTTTHHLEDLPPITTHAAVLSGGRLVACGPVADVLTSDTLSAAYGARLRAWHDAGGWHLALAD